MLALSPDNGSAEKRKLSEFPEFITENGNINLKWTSEFETYASEHFGFRSALVTANAVTKARIFGESANDDVVIGKDGWLFYSATLDDYFGRDRMSERELFATKRSLYLMSEYAASLGADFIFAPVPNKNSVYGEYMPAGYTASSDESSLRRLLTSLDGEDGVTAVDFGAVFTESEDQLYHKRDTHWNNLGAVMAQRILTEEAGVTFTDFAAVGVHTERIWDGDLDGMLFPTLGNKDEQTVYDYGFTYEYTSRFKSVEDTVVNTASSGGSKRLLMFRDSFGNALLPFMAEDFAAARFIRSTPYRMDLAAELDSDTVILEVAERNLRTILSYPAVMDAPVRPVEGTAITCDGLKLKDEFSMLHITGVIPELPDNALIYVSVGGTVYEATPAAGNGFSLFTSQLTADGITADDVKVSIVNQ